MRKKTPAKPLSAGAALRPSKEQYRAIFENSQIGIYRTTPDGLILLSNPALIQMLGFSSFEELVGRNLESEGLIEDSARSRFKELIEAAGEIKGFETTWKKRDGSFIFVSENAKAVRGKDGAILFYDGTVEDITVRKQAEEALRQSEERFRAIFDSVDDAIIVQDLENDAILEVNQKMYEMWGYARSEVLQVSVGQLSAGEPPYSQNEFFEWIARARSGAAQLFEWKARHKNGRAFWTEVNMRRAAIGDLDVVLMVVRDIGERKQAAQVLREREQRYRSVFEYVPVGIFQSTPEGKYVYVNPELARLFGYDSPQDLIETVDRLDIATALYVDPARHAALVAEVVNSDSWKQLVTDLPNCEQLIACDLHAVASSTMVREGQLVGAIVVANLRDARPFTNDELTLLKGIGNQAAQAILNNRLFSNVQRHLQCEHLLHTVDLVISTSNSDLAFSLDLILCQVASQLKVDAVDILLLNPDQGVFEYQAGCGFISGAIRSTCLRADSVAGDSINPQTRIIRLPSLGESSLGPARREMLKAEGFASYFGSPLVIKDQARGLLEVFHRSPLDPDREWLDFLGALSTQIAVGIDNIILFENLQNSNANLEQAYDTTLEGWSRALDLRDRETEGHSQRVTAMTVALVQALGISKAELVHIRRGALLHDIGKMGVPDEILRKSNQLTEQDWIIMRKHPEFAYELLKPVDFLRPALQPGLV